MSVLLSGLQSSHHGISRADFLSLIIHVLVARFPQLHFPIMISVLLRFCCLPLFPGYQRIPIVLTFFPTQQPYTFYCVALLSFRYSSKRNDIVLFQHPFQCFNLTPEIVTNYAVTASAFSSASIWVCILSTTNCTCCTSVCR